MIYVSALIFFVFGLIIGSFLNVVILRLNTNKTLGGRSACMSCNNKLCWYELIPLFSFLFLKGRCNFCKSKISLQYPLVEFATGIVFFLLFIKFQNILIINPIYFILFYFYYVLMFVLLIIIAGYDFKHKIIPDSLVFLFAILAFISLFFFHSDGYFIFSGFYFHLPSLFEFFSGIILALPFILLWLVSAGKWIGLGDAKLALGIGYFLHLGSGLSAIAIAFWTGAIVGIFLILFNKNYNMKTEIPFAFYLVFGTLFAFLFNLHLFSF